MTIYHLGFNYGWYDDATEVYFGCYSTKEKRDEAKNRYLIAQQNQPEGILHFLGLSPEDGNWAEWETILDEDFHPYE
jgi:hypothetical protein